MKNSIWFLLGLLVLVSCKKKVVSYEELLNSRDTTKVYEALHFGIRFGMSPKDYFDHCRKLNAEGKLFDGDGSMVSKSICTELSEPAFMYIQPLYDATNHINGQSLFFRYQNASIFNAKLSIDNLEKDVFKWMCTHYGTTYARISETDHDALVWIDGNLSLKFTKEIDQIKVEISDLRKK
jgi:hypothetical protein